VGEELSPSTGARTSRRYRDLTESSPSDQNHRFTSSAARLPLYDRTNFARFEARATDGPCGPRARPDRNAVENAVRTMRSVPAGHLHERPSLLANHERGGLWVLHITHRQRASCRTHVDAQQQCHKFRSSHRRPLCAILSERQRPVRAAPSAAHPVPNRPGEIRSHSMHSIERIRVIEGRPGDRLPAHAVRSGRRAPNLHRIPSPSTDRVFVPFRRAGDLSTKDGGNLPQRPGAYGLTRSDRRNRSADGDSLPRTRCGRRPRTPA
jgi:hypothetical protein